MDRHRQLIKGKCRVCKNKVNIVRHKRGHSESPPKLCRKYIQEIEKAFKIDCKDDNSDQHPQYLCTSCYRICTRVRRGESSYNLTVPVDWPVHPRTGPCPICHDKPAFRKGRKPKNKTKHYRVTHDRLPFLLRVPNIFIQIQSTTNQYNNLVLNTRDPDIIKLFNCNLCNSVLSSPVMLPCEHYFCSVCLTKRFQMTHAAAINCPTCNATCHYNDVKSVPRAFGIMFEKYLTEEPSEPSTLHTSLEPGSAAFTFPAAQHLTKLALERSPDDPIERPILDAVGAWMGVMTKKEQIVQLRSKPTARKVSIIISMSWTAV